MQAVSGAVSCRVAVAAGAAFEASAAPSKSVGLAGKGLRAAGRFLSVGNSAVRGAAVLGIKAGSVQRAAAPRRQTVMKADSVAAGYAQALLEAASAAGGLDDVVKDMEFLDTLLSSNEDFSTFISNPTARDDEKKNLFAAVSSQAGLKPITSTFFSLLVDKKRTDILGDIITAFEESYFELTDTQVAIVTSAIELETAEQGLIAQKLQTLTGAKNIKLKVKVDPSLLAGFAIQYGPDLSAFIDLSVKGQLAILEKELFNSPVNAL